MVVFDDTLDSNQKPIDPFLTRGTQRFRCLKCNNLVLIYQKEQWEITLLKPICLIILWEKLGIIMEIMLALI